MMNILSDLLNLYSKSEDISINLIPEFFQFSFGKKNIIRFSVNFLDFIKVKKFAENHNFYFDYAEFSVYSDGNNWSTLLPKNSLKQNSDDESIFVLTLGHNKSLVKECLKAEIDFDFEKAGELLGYPVCCIKSYPQIDLFKENWVQYYYEKHPNSYQSYLNNRITSFHGNGCFSGEFFPCNLECSETRQIASISENLMKSSGYLSLHKLFKNHCLTPTYLNEDGKVVSYITNNFIRFK